MKKILSIILGTCLFCSSLKGQIKISDAGIATGFGYALNNRSVPEGVYRLAYFQRLVRSQILPKSRQRGIFEAVYLGIEPQYNLVWIDDEQNNFELGLHFFIQPTFGLSERLKAFFIAGIGPHYFSTSTVSQARGFIFADAMGLGMSLQISTRISIFTNFRIRHLSNANTRMPNFGINTNNFHFGFICEI